MRKHFVRRVTQTFIIGLALSLGAIVSASAQTAKPQPPAGKAPGVATADALFIRTAGEAGKAEVDLAKLAIEKSTNANVKAFAEALRNDHEKANAELGELADRKGVTVAATTASAKAMHNKLAAMSGAEFDKAFLAEMVSDHEKAVSDFTKESKNTKDADIQAFTDKALPTLKDHLARAKDLKAGSVAPHAAGAPAAPVAGGSQGSSDDTLKDRIAYRLETSPITKKYDVNVKVASGVATLTGSVATAAQKAEAGKLAMVSGVTRVDNQLKVDPDADKTLTERAKNGMRRTGEAITDSWITTKVKWFYVGDDVLKGSNINVDTKDRVVTLNGTVPSAAARTRAMDLANDTDGVLKVVDNLKITGK
jgi:putative membrane protein